MTMSSRGSGVSSDNSDPDDQNMSSSLNNVENSRPKKSRMTNRSTHRAAGRSDDFHSQPSTSSISCLMCSFRHIDSKVVEEHMNSVHFDLVIQPAEPNLCEKPEIISSSKCPEFSTDTKDRGTRLNARFRCSMNGVGGRIDDSFSQPSTSSISCFFCPFKHIDSSAVEEHINSVHFDQVSSTVPNSHQETDFSCPMCPKTFPNAKDLRVHVNRKHKDILSPIKASPSSEKSEAVSVCPVCSVFSSESTEELQKHVDQHFSNPDQPDTACDRSVAEKVSKELKAKEDREFELLQAQYGMNDKGNFKTQSTTNMQRAVCSGKLSLPEYYEKERKLRSAEHRGVDDGNSRVIDKLLGLHVSEMISVLVNFNCDLWSSTDVIPRIREKSRVSSNVNETYVCYNTDFYGSSFGDRGWGCGYRNIQMLLSALSRNKIFSELLSNHFPSSNFNDAQSVKKSMPSISKIQEMIEWAWEEGFDAKGREQLSGKLCGTRKWIGATEVVALLSSMKIKCELVDVWKPTVAKIHYRLLSWIVTYFKKKDSFKPPLYLQHDGHSRTIIGVEILKDNDVTLLILDPGIESYKIDNMLTSSNQFSTLKLVRRSLSSLNNKQYQIVSISGVIASEEEYQASKVLHSTKLQ